MIAIYNDEGTSDLGVYCIKKYLEDIGQAYETVDAEDIKNGALSTCSVLIMPGGRDLPYKEKLGTVGNEKIREFVKNGGTYVGICAGAYYACSHFNFKGDKLDSNGNKTPYIIDEDRELKLFKGGAKGSLTEFTNDIPFDGTSASASIIEIILGDEKFYTLYWGGPEFIGAKPNQILATYSNGKVAAVQDSCGKGRYILMGFHPELLPQYIEMFLKEKGNSSVEENKIIEMLLKIDQTLILNNILNNFK